MIVPGSLHPGEAHGAHKSRYGTRQKVARKKRAGRSAPSSGGQAG